MLQKVDDVPVSIVANWCLRFSSLLSTELLDLVDNINDPRCRVDITRLIDLPELKVNPFNVSLCKVFSGGRESMLFEEFLDMMSVLSEYTPSHVRLTHLHILHPIFVL